MGLLREAFLILVEYGLLGLSVGSVVLGILCFIIALIYMPDSVQTGKTSEYQERPTHPYTNE